MAWTTANINRQMNILVQGGLTPHGAAGLVSRWVNVENPGGDPSVLGGYMGRAFGNAQWLGSRKPALFSWSEDNGLDPYNADTQSLFALHELNTTESRAGEVLKNAQTSWDGAVGASMFERAEGFDPGSGFDNFTARTEKGVGGILSGYMNSTGESTALEESGLAGNDFSDLPGAVDTAVAGGDIEGAGKEVAKTGKITPTKTQRAPEGSDLVQAVNKQSEQLAKNTAAIIQASAKNTSASIGAASGISTGIQSLASNLFVRGALIALGAIFVLAGVFGLAFGGNGLKSAVATVKKIPA